MAVNISIPGIGTVSADNAATESTLNSLLAAVRGQNTIIRSNESTIAYAQTLQERSAQAVNNQFGSIAASANQAGSSVSRFANDASAGLDGVTQRSYSLGQYLTDLGASAAGLADRMIMSTSDLAKNPISSSIKTMNTVITASAGGLSALVGLFTKSGKAGGSAMDQNAQKANTFSEMIKDGGEALVYVNNFLGAQLQTTVDSFQEFNRMGTVFHGGMTTIRVAAGKAGTTLDQFTMGIRSSIDSVRAMGMGTQFGTLAVAKGMEVLRAETHAMTVVTRNAAGDEVSREVVQSKYTESLRRLGYETEDQVALVADYLSVQRATMTADQFRDFTREGMDKDVAARTLDYAKNLKLISDLTGASAAEVAKEARARSLSSLSLAMLDGDQREIFGGIQTMMKEQGAGFINTALDQLVASGGSTITDKSFLRLTTQFPELKTFVDGLYQSVTSGEMSATEASAAAAKQYGELSEKMRQRMPEVRELIAAATLSGDGDLGQLVQMLDVIGGNTVDGQVVDQTQAAIDAIVTMPDKLTAAVTQNAEELLSIAVSIEQASTKVLRPYASALVGINQLMADFVQAAMNAGVGIYNFGGMITEAGAKLKSWGGNLVADVMGNGSGVNAASENPQPKNKIDSGDVVSKPTSWNDPANAAKNANQKREAIATDQEMYAQNNNNNIADNPADKLAEEMKNMVTKLIEQNATTTKILLASQNTANTVDKIYKATVA